MRRISTVLTLILFLFLQPSECGIKEAFNYLCDNYEYLSAKLENRAFSDKDSTVRLNFPLKKEFFSIIKNHKRDSSKIADAIYLSASHLFSYASNGTFVITDSISINFLCKLIVCKKRSKDEINYSEMALQTLRENTGFDALERYKGNITSALQQSRANIMGEVVLSLTRPDSIVCKKIFKDLPPENRARLGDTTSLNELLDVYEKDKNEYFSRSIIIKRLLITGQEKAIKRVLTDFDDPLYVIDKAYVNAPPCTSYSTQIDILKALRRLYPDDKLLNQGLYRVTGSVRNNPAEVRNFLNEFDIWMKNKFGIVSENKNNVSIIYHGCIQF